MTILKDAARSAAAVAVALVVLAWAVLPRPAKNVGRRPRTGPLR